MNEEQRKELVQLALKLVEERESWEIMSENKEFREEGKFSKWYEGVSTVGFQYERIIIPGSVSQTIDSDGSAENPDWVYSKHFKMSTSAISGSIETPWFGRTYDKETFLAELDYRFGFFLSKLGIFTFKSIKTELRLASLD